MDARRQTPENDGANVLALRSPWTTQRQPKDKHQNTMNRPGDDGQEPRNTTSGHAESPGKGRQGATTEAKADAKRFDGDEGTKNIALHRFNRFSVNRNGQQLLQRTSVPHDESL